MLRRNLLSRWGLLALVAVSACAIPPPAHPMVDARGALERMQAEQACIQGFSGAVKIDHLSSQGRVRGEAALMTLAPDRIRVDVMSPVGGIVFSLTSNGRRFEMLDVGNRQFLVGEASGCQLARLTGVAMDGAILVQLLRGEAPLLAGPVTRRVTWDDGGFYRVNGVAADGSEEEFHLALFARQGDTMPGAQRVFLTYWRLEQEGRVRFEVELSRHQSLSTAPPREDPDGLDPSIPPSGGKCHAVVPHTLRLIAPDEGADVVLNIASGMHNPPIVPGAFRQVVPEGVQVLQAPRCQP